MSEPNALPERIIDGQLISELYGTQHIAVAVILDDNHTELWIFRHISIKLLEAMQAVITNNCAMKDSILSAVSQESSFRIRGVIRSCPPITANTNDNTIEPYLNDSEKIQAIKTSLNIEIHTHKDQVLKTLPGYDINKTIPESDALIEPIHKFCNIYQLTYVYIHLLTTLVLEAILDKIEMVLDDQSRLTKYNYQYHFKQYALQARLYDHPIFKTLDHVAQKNLLQTIQYEVELELEKLKIVRRVLNHTQ